MTVRVSRKADRLDYLEVFAISFNRDPPSNICLTPADLSTCGNSLDPKHEPFLVELCRSGPGHRPSSIVSFPRQKVNFCLLP